MRLKEIVCNRLVSVGVMRNDRSFLGINIQTMYNDKITEFTLSEIELFVRHIANNLKTVILNELKKYWISVNQIYLVTSDNGANILKAVKHIQDELCIPESKSDDEESISISTIL